MMVVIGVVFGLSIITYDFDRSSDEDILQPILESVVVSDVGKLLIENEIKYVSDKLIVTHDISFDGDPGCGAVIDVNSQTHWFRIDSISEPKEMTLYSENPNACKVNTDSCFCNVQMDLTALTFEKLSYFTPEEEEKYSSILLDYIKNDPGMINIDPKFKIGKFNLNFTDTDAIGYCGERSGDHRNAFFRGAIVNGNIESYNLEKEFSPLCAISNDAKWWEKK